MTNIDELLLDATNELFDATQARDEYEIEYELEKARMMTSAELNNAFGNQTQRDAEVIKQMDEKGMYRKMAEYKSQARMAWYRWSALKAIKTGKGSDE